MKRRSFLKTSSLAFSAFFVTRSITARERLHEAWLKFGGPSIVKGARPVPTFTPVVPRKGEGMRFLVMGDWGTGASGQASVARSMARTADRNGCDYIISTGDNIYPKGVASADDPQWKRKFEDIYAGQGLKQPVFPTLGNHDYGLDPDAQIAYAKINPQWRFFRGYCLRLGFLDGWRGLVFHLIEANYVRRKYLGLYMRGKGLPA